MQPLALRTHSSREQLHQQNGHLLVVCHTWHDLKCTADTRNQIRFRNQPYPPSRSQAAQFNARANPPSSRVSSLNVFRRKEIVMRRSFELPSPTTIEAVEQRLCVSFPSDYREFLLTANGGVPERYLHFHVADHGDVMLGAILALDQIELRSILNTSRSRRLYGNHYRAAILLLPMIRWKLGIAEYHRARCRTCLVLGSSRVVGW